MCTYNTDLRIAQPIDSTTLAKSIYCDIIRNVNLPLRNNPKLTLCVERNEEQKEERRWEDIEGHD